MGDLPIKFKDEAKGLSATLRAPESAEVPAEGEELTIVVIIGQHVGVIRPGPIVYDWAF